MCTTPPRAGNTKTAGTETRPGGSMPLPYSIPEISSAKASALTPTVEKNA